MASASSVSGMSDSDDVDTQESSVRGQGTEDSYSESATSHDYETLDMAHSGDEEESEHSMPMPRDTPRRSYNDTKGKRTERQVDRSHDRPSGHTSTRSGSTRTSKSSSRRHVDENDRRDHSKKSPGRTTQARSASSKTTRGPMKWPRGFKITIHSDKELERLENLKDYQSDQLIDAMEDLKDVVDHRWPNITTTIRFRAEDRGFIQPFTRAVWYGYIEDDRGEKICDITNRQNKVKYTYSLLELVEYSTSEIEKDLKKRKRRAERQTR